LYSTDNTTALGIYKFHTVAYDDTENSTQSNIVIVELSNGAMSINELDNNSFGLYPNPSSGYIIIESLMFDEINNVEIFDVTGKSIKQVESTLANKLKVDISNLEKGIYFVKITTVNGIAFKQLLKN